LNTWLIRYKIKAFFWQTITGIHTFEGQKFKDIKELEKYQKIGKLFEVTSNQSKSQAKNKYLDWSTRKSIKYNILEAEIGSRLIP
jgi:hypothetical protein